MMIKAAKAMYSKAMRIEWKWIWLGYPVLGIFFHGHRSATYATAIEHRSAEGDMRGTP
jgi:hypothetical protein